MKDPLQRQQLNRRAGQFLAERALPESLRLAALSAAAPGESAAPFSGTSSNVNNCSFSCGSITSRRERCFSSEGSCNWTVDTDKNGTSSSGHLQLSQSGSR